MDMQAADVLGLLSQSLERMAAAATQMERTVATLEEKHSEISGQVAKIVATVESEPGRREAELEQKLKAAEARIAELQAQAGRSSSSRKTLPVSAAQLLSKDGVSGIEQVEAGALDAALNGLSLEQRIAVKSQLMRAGKLV